MVLMVFRNHSLFLVTFIHFSFLIIIRLRQRFLSPQFLCFDPRWKTQLDSLSIVSMGSFKIHVCGGEAGELTVNY